MTLLFIFVSLGLQNIHLSHDKKDDTTNRLSCAITVICFSVRTHTKVEISLSPLALTPYREQVDGQSVKMKIVVVVVIFI